MVAGRVLSSTSVANDLGSENLALGPVSVMTHLPTVAALKDNGDISHGDELYQGTKHGNTVHDCHLSDLVVSIFVSEDYCVSVPLEGQGVAEPVRWHAEQCHGEHRV